MRKVRLSVLASAIALIVGITHLVHQSPTTTVSRSSTSAESIIRGLSWRLTNAKAEEKPAAPLELQINSIIPQDKLLAVDCSKQWELPVLLQEPRQEELPTITIVYFAYLLEGGSSRYVIASQINDMVSTGLLDHATLHIIFSTNSTEELEWSHEFIQTNSTLPSASTRVYTLDKNLYEFPGIHLLWLLACQDPKGLFLYFHSKGVTHTDGSSGQRSPGELLLFQEIIVSWRYIIQLFQAKPDIKTIGMAAGGFGWQWFNFYWARGSYLISLVEPLVTTRRHYYEDWLCRGSEKKEGDCPVLWQDSWLEFNLSSLPVPIAMSPPAITSSIYARVEEADGQQQLGNNSRPGHLSLMSCSYSGVPKESVFLMVEAAVFLKARMKEMSLLSNGSFAHV